MEYLTEKPYPVQKLLLPPDI